MDWTLVCAIPQNDIWLQTQYILNIIIVICIVVILSMTLISFVFTSNISKPLDILREGFETLESGHFDVALPVMREDEMGQLIHSFNNTAHQLSDYFERVLQEQKQRTEQEIRALQYQINPHFLYNTLNSVRLLAILNKDNAVSDVTDALIGYLRTTIDTHTPFICVQDEFENIKQYIYIQNVRYANAIEVRYRMEEDIKGCLILKLIVQPLIENAIFYGISAQGKGKIDISASHQDQTLYLTVEDNGVGMTEQQVQEISPESGSASSSPQYDQNHIGIRNVDKRVKLYYGAEFGLTIRSTLGKGTRVTIKMPCKWKEEGDKDHANSDC